MSSVNFIEISGVRTLKNDSRLVRPGDIYVTSSSDQKLASEYILNAAQNGAIAVILSDKLKVDKLPNIRYYTVADPLLCMRELAAFFYPKQPEFTVAVTGTNGKTSVATFYMQICALLNMKSASIGTLGVEVSDKTVDFTANSEILAASQTLTTPDHISLRYFLDKLAQNNVTHLAIEASSHGLDQNRIDEINFKAAGFTNFSQDHLDYHDSLDSYFTAKLRLFHEVIDVNASAVLNADIDVFNKLYTCCSLRKINVLQYGKSANDIRFVGHDNGYALLDVFGKRYKIMLQIQHEFQIYNIMCAVGLAISAGFYIDDILASTEKIKAAPGRLEVISNANGKTIYIDYAHTPDGLHTVLLALRKGCLNKLHVLFGCGGNRDKSKRIIMGSIAGNIADSVIVTDDNPRNEDAAKIRADIIAGISDKSKVIEISNRKDAITEAIKMMQDEDVLLIAGKGHEEYQIIGDQKYKFSDAETTKDILRNLECIQTY